MLFRSCQKFNISTHCCLTKFGISITGCYLMVFFVFFGQKSGSSSNQVDLIKLCFRSMPFQPNSLPSCIDSFVSLIKSLFSAFHHTAYLIPYGRLLESTLCHDSGLPRPHIQGDDVFRITIHDDVGVMRNHQHLSFLFNLPQLRHDQIINYRVYGS